MREHQPCPPGLCAKSAECADTHCPGRREALAAQRSCGACTGTCHAPQACHQPEPDRPKTFRPTFDITGPHLPRTRAGWGRLVMFATGCAGIAFIAQAVIRNFF